MLRALVAGFGESIGADTLAELRELGVELIRQGGRAHDQLLLPDQCAALVAEIETAGMRCYFSVFNVGQLYELPRGTWVGLHNEPDLEGIAPARYRFDVTKAKHICAERGLVLWGGEVSNLNDRGLNYLRELCAGRDEAAVAYARKLLTPERAAAFEKASGSDMPDRVTVHWYPNKAKPRTVGHEGRTREQEVEALRQIIGARPFGVGEFGFHTARECRGWWLWRRCQQLTDLQAAQAIQDEFVFWERMGAAFACLYQCGDGPTEDAIDRMGIRRHDRTWKIQSQAFRKTAGRSVGA